jgi:thioredoxin reductase (NADPH)
VADPLILAVEEDPEARQAIERELLDRYARSYRVACPRFPEEALALLEAEAAAGEQVALVLAARELAGMTGDELLARTHRLHPQAKRAVLIDWGAMGDPVAGTAIFDAMARGDFDHYLLRPARPPDELFHQAVSGFLLEWAQSRRIAPHTIHVVGESWTGRAYELRQVLGRCAMPHSFHLADSAEGRRILTGAGVDRDADLPLVLFPNGDVLADPTDADLALGAGAPIEPSRAMFDVVIVGAGPAGLSAAVYGASEGFATLVVDEGGIGGQATSSSLIRNYLGFPRGLTGGRLAQRAYEQAWIFGASYALMQRVTHLEADGGRLLLDLSVSGRVSARAVILALGATYRRLAVPELEALGGAGVFYGGASSEAPAMADRDVYVVGGANSAGQAALHLARYARRVTLVVRADSLGAGMSQYLVREVEASSRIQVRLRSEVVGGGGDGWLQHLVLRDASGARETVPADGLFLMIGARPRTDWLPDEIRRDDQGFILTGAEVRDDPAWPLERHPHPLETSLPGVLAAGDVRHGSVKRVASAVGEGSVAVQTLHSVLAGDPLRRRGGTDSGVGVGR